MSHEPALFCRRRRSVLRVDRQFCSVESDDTCWGSSEPRRPRRQTQPEPMHTVWILIVAWLAVASSGCARTLELPEGTTADFVMVEKSARRLTLYAAGVPLKSYPVALGREPEGGSVRDTHVAVGCGRQGSGDASVRGNTLLRAAVRRDWGREFGRLQGASRKVDRMPAYLPTFLPAYLSAESQARRSRLSSLMRAALPRSSRR